MRISKISAFFTFFLLAESMAVALDFNFGISSREAESAVSESTIICDIQFLSDTLCGGRATGSRGAVETSAWISRQYRQIGLLPSGGLFTRSFETNSLVGRNVMGFFPGFGDKYVIVAAHYDNIGFLDGKFYPGADSNASGVAALLSIARMFRTMDILGRSYSHNIIFVALDAKQHSLAGSRALWEDISAGLIADPRTGRRIRRGDISLFVNLDILGASLSPIREDRKDYLLMLGGTGYLESELRDANRDFNICLDLGFDYYGSDNFTDLFLKRVSDQKVFKENGIPSVMFTSGITMTTNRTEDTPGSLDIPVLKKRIYLIYHWMDRIIPFL